MTGSGTPSSADHHQALMGEIRKYSDEEPRWRR
jgi:hypothetical protein